jgi:hypothetical protein
MNLHHMKRIASAVTPGQAAQIGETGTPFGSLDAPLHAARATTVVDRVAAPIETSAPAREGRE